MYIQYILVESYAYAYVCGSMRPETILEARAKRPAGIHDL